MFKSSNDIILNPTDVNAIINTALNACSTILLNCEIGAPVQARNIGASEYLPEGVKAKRTTYRSTGVDSCSFTITSDLYKCITTFTFEPILFNNDDTGGTLKSVCIQLFKNDTKHALSQSTVTLHPYAKYTNQVILAYETIREFFDRNGFPQDLAYKNPAFDNYIDMEFASPFAD